MEALAELATLAISAAVSWYLPQQQKTTVLLCNYSLIYDFTLDISRTDQRGWDENLILKHLSLKTKISLTENVAGAKVLLWVHCSHSFSSVMLFFCLWWQLVWRSLTRIEKVKVHLKGKCETGLAFTAKGTNPNAHTNTHTQISYPLHSPLTVLHTVQRQCSVSSVGL